MEGENAFIVERWGGITICLQRIFGEDHLIELDFQKAKIKIGS